MWLLSPRVVCNKCPQETLSSRPFQFEVKPGARAYNQAHYEALGEVGRHSDWIE